MKVVADTNTLVSALLWHGPPRQLLGAIESGNVELVTSVALRLELDDVIHRPKFRRQIREQKINLSHLLSDLDARLTILNCPPLAAPVVIADPDDDAVLACAVAAGVDGIVTGDDDLLALRSFRGIPILTAAQALAKLRLRKPITARSARRS